MVAGEGAKFCPVKRGTYISCLVAKWMGWDDIAVVIRGLLFDLRPALYPWAVFKEQ